MSNVPRVVRVHDGTGYRTALLVTEGPKYAGLIWAESTGMRIARLPWVEQVKGRVIKLTLGEVEYKGKPYPVARAKKKLRQFGAKVGITKSAKLTLRA